MSTTTRQNNFVICYSYITSLMCVLTTLCPKKWPRFYFWTNSLKIKPISITFGTQNPENILHTCCRMSTTPEKCRHCTLRNVDDIIFISSSNLICSQSTQSRSFLLQQKNDHCSFLWTFFRCNGQVQKQISTFLPEFFVQEIIQISWFLMELVGKYEVGTFWDTLHSLSIDVC